MFKKFKEIILEMLVHNQAHFEVQQEKSRSMFKEETPEQIKQKLKEINDMMKRPTPEENEKLMARIDAGIEPTYEQVMKKQKEADEQSVMFKAANIRREVNSWSDSAKNKAVLHIVADNIRQKAVDSIKSVRDNAFKTNKDNKLEI